MHKIQATKVTSPPQKSNLISCEPLVHISDIKLIRTDTTLDLSQKAEKAIHQIGSSNRIMFHLIIKKKSFKNFFQQTIQKRLENCLLPFLNHVSEVGAQVDLQDVLNRFTFDSIFTIVFGFDPNCFPNKFSELREISYLKSLPVMEEVILYRHFIPCCLWKQQKWLNIR
ncbi:cytochrome P450 family 96 protein, putative [Medicago truncatula]|uniref:Cytochrome P450 family 96 protein, putative n=1 Tax=Medicago truncatula TaxID=3880 RepID=G7IDF7_MEDTR|nr:cytochrome P450 family 96 protein, putative [Medicago truncatula]